MNPNASAVRVQGATAKTNVIRPTEKTVVSSDVPQQRTIRLRVWQCQECGNNCTVLRPENRCLCGHRYKEHKHASGAGKPQPCGVARCPCQDFFYIMAEGAWVIRCRCKHKHIEHNPAGKDGKYKCEKRGCTCLAFDSPWVCNCNHPWASHRHVWIDKELSSLPIVQDDFGDPSLIKRGLTSDK